MENYSIKVYVRLNEKEEVLELNSSIHLQNTEGWTLIDEGPGGDKYAHPQGNYFEEDQPSLHDELGRPNYKYVNNKLVLIPDDEKEAPVVNTNPSLEERVIQTEADIKYIMIYNDIK